MDQSANKPRPHCRAILLCEKVSENPGSGAISLHEIIETLRMAAVPGPSSPFVVFLQLYDGIGRYRMSMEINALDDDTSIARAALADLHFPERLANIDVAIPVDFVYLPRPGRYELIVFVDGQELARQYFNAGTENDTE